MPLLFHLTIRMHVPIIRYTERTFVCKGDDFVEQQHTTIEETHDNEDLWGLGESSLLLIEEEIEALLKETSHE